jgi:outer membrane biosynthesis protein TonB
MTDLNTLTCEPIPNVVAHEMLQNISLAICHPAEASPEQAASLTRQLVYTALAFDPRDGLEIQLAGMVYGHCGLILDSMKDVQSGLTPMEKLRIKRNIVDMDNKLLALLREYRAERERPAAQRPTVQAPVAQAPMAHPPVAQPPKAAPPEPSPPEPSSAAEAAPDPAPAATPAASHPRPPAAPRPATPQQATPQQAAPQQAATQQAAQAAHPLHAHQRSTGVPSRR